MPGAPDSAAPTPLAYRPDIDGLRAVAVLSVLAFHKGLFQLPGGFIGVDVFFVISGYLISSLILKDLAHGTFSFRRFYERRVRRIFPALFVMMALVSLVACVLMVPVELITYAKSVIAAAFSAANIFFLNKSGYFDAPFDYPILHTWSLGVEEQFYLLFPMLLVALHRWLPRHMRAAVVLLLLLSFAASTLAVLRYPLQAFYLLHLRAWELLIGALLAMKAFPRIPSALLRNAAALTGLGLILFADFSYTPFTRFPGPAAVVPCLGAALIIGAGESGPSAVGWLLSLRPVVFIGLISYSLYLWHWPVIIAQNWGIFGRMEHGLVPVLSILLAWLSWRFVERPFRNGRLKLTGLPLYATTAGALVSVTIFTVFVLHTDGIAARFPGRAGAMASRLNVLSTTPHNTRDPECFLMPDGRIDQFRPDICLRIDPARPNYLLLGDSHAAVLWSGLTTADPQANYLQANATPCGPYVHPDGTEACDDLMHFIYQKFLPEHPVRALLISRIWNISDESDDDRGIAETVQWAGAHGIRVLVVGPVPRYEAPLPRLLAYSIVLNKPGLPKLYLRIEEASVDAHLQAMCDGVWHVPYISIYQMLCPDGVCALYADEAQLVPIEADTNHLTAEASLLVARRVVAQDVLP
jgi:peptidoglycan/LPS O-acetylase OafA/YrhL